MYRGQFALKSKPIHLAAIEFMVDDCLAYFSAERLDDARYADADHGYRLAASARSATRSCSDFSAANSASQLMSADSSGRMASAHI